MAMSHVAGRALKDPAINVEEIDPKGLLWHVAGTGYGDDIPAVSLAFLELWHCAFKMNNNNTKKKRAQHEMSTGSTCYCSGSFSFPH